MSMKPNVSIYAVDDPSHYNSKLWNKETLLYIQQEVASNLQKLVNKYIIVTEEKIKEVVFTISQANPRTDTDHVIHMIIQFITQYIADEETVNQKPEYNSRVLLYDGTYGIQRMATGSLGIKKKGLNTFGYLRR